MDAEIVTPSPQNTLAPCPTRSRWIRLADQVPCNADARPHGYLLERWEDGGANYVPWQNVTAPYWMPLPELNEPPAAPCPIKESSRSSSWFCILCRKDNPREARKCVHCGNPYSNEVPCPIKNEGEETTELKISEAKADNVNAVLRNDRESPFQDSPLLAAKRRAFDNPTLANLDLLIDEAIKATHRLTRQSIAEHLAKACQWLDEFVEMPEMFPSDRDVQWWEERRQGIRDLARQALPSEHGGGSTTSGASLENPSPSVSDSNAAQTEELDIHKPFPCKKCGGFADWVGMKYICRTCKRELPTAEWSPAGSAEKEADATAVPAPRQNELSELLDQIVQRANEAIDGPWFVASDDLEAGPHTNSGLALIETGRTYDWWPARLCEWPTARFIAAARSDVPALVKALRRAVEQLEYVDPDRAGSTAVTISEIAQLLREPAESKQEN